MRSRASLLLAALFFIIVPLFSAVAEPVVAGSGTPLDVNRVILQQIATMPTGGDYMAGGTALTRMQDAVTASPDRLSIRAEQAVPSFCSSATYLVLLKTLGALQARGDLALTPATLRALAEIAGQPDGRGAWGRWNANGPGTARLFHELELGPNFSDYAQARAGDFMKIFWTAEVGQRERGHSVIFLGEETINGVPSVKFWSSNLHGGYSAKAVPKAKIARALFSRLERPERFNALAEIPRTDAYLASLLSVASSWNAVRKQCGF